MQSLKETEREEFAMKEENRELLDTFQIDKPEVLDIPTETDDAADAPAAKAPEQNKAPHKKTAKKKGSSTAKKSSAHKGKHHKKSKKKKQMQSAYLHIIFIALILLIAIVGIIKLVKWNKGRESGYDPNEISTEFDTEPEDYFVPLDSATAALQKQDDVTSILLLGNGTLAKTKGEKDSIGMQLEAMTGGKVYDASLDHTYLSVKNAVYDEEYQSDVFSLYWLSQCIASGDFTLLTDNARSWEGDDSVQDTVEMLKSLDMASIDVITIMYDYHDYEDERLLAGPYDEAMAATCCGCLLQSIRLLQQAYPHIRIIVSSPYFCFVEDPDDQMQAGGSYDMGQGTLADYMIAYKNIAVNTNVSFIDNYFGTITADNYENYLEENQQYLNAKGREAIAERIAAFIG